MTARKTRQYVATAVDSLTLAIELFNRPSPTGREHATVMMAAHAFEMLLKGAIYEERKKVRFSGGDRSFDPVKCVAVAETSLGILDAGDRVVLLAPKEDRDTATHDVILMSDDVLWLHLRSAVTIFWKVLLGLTGQNLTDVMPGRVLPVSASPPTDVSLVVGKEVEQIAELLRPGRRQSADARSRLLPLIRLRTRGAALPALCTPHREGQIHEPLKPLLSALPAKALVISWASRRLHRRRFRRFAVLSQGCFCNVAAEHPGTVPVVLLGGPIKRPGFCLLPAPITASAPSRCAILPSDT